MSRHRAAYDDDDLYDYDDYDDEEEYYEDDRAYGGQTDHATGSSASASAAGAGSIAREPPKAYVQFVMESLGEVDVTPSGGLVTGNISEARVLQMLEAYDCDVERTIDYFLTQREKANVTSAAPPKPPPAAPVKSTTTGSKASGNAGQQSKANKPLTTTAKDATKSKGQSQQQSKQSHVAVSTQDLNMMGFSSSVSASGDTLADEGPTNASTGISDSTSSVPTSTLIVASAPLSDDEYETSGKSDSGGGRLLPHLTLVVAGHVDAGKSTLVGNLLYKVGSVGQRTIHKYEKESKQTGKGSFALAWVMDESQSEREHGVTIDLAERELKTDHRHFTILDAPGHRDFIPNMISGAAQADVALLVIPASAGEYESSMSDGAQTREHAVLLKALGVKQVIVVVNKMDTIQPAWDPVRFSRIESEIGALLAELQFPPRSVRFVPLSGLTGENLVALSETCALRAWYTGKTLLHMMNSVQPPTRRTRAPLRAVITSVLSAHGSVAKGCDVAVSVLQGTLRVGRGVGLASAAGAATAKKLLDADGGPLSAITAGSKGTVQLVDRSGRTGEEMGLVEGMVLCKGPPLPRQSMKFKASLHTMSTLQPPIIPGSTFELYLHGSVTECRITKLYSMTADSGAMATASSGKQSKSGGGGGSKYTKKSPQLRSVGVSADNGCGGIVERPKCVPGGRTAKVKIELNVGVCIEPFKVCDALGRFALRSKGKTCAVGICEKVKVST